MSALPGRRRRTPPPLAESLQLLAEGLSDLVGFGAVVVNVADGDDMVIVAAAGPEHALRVVQGVLQSPSQMIGSHWPIAFLRRQLEHAEQWGRFHYVPHERIVGLPPVALTTHPVGERPEPDAWHPLDLLFALMHDPAGRLRGVVNVDGPVTGRLPDESQRRVMDRYATQAERVLVTAIERVELAQEKRLIEAATDVVRLSGAAESLDEVMDRARRILIEAFDLETLWGQLLDADGVQHVQHFGGERPAGMDQLEPLAAEIARRLWARGQAGALGTDELTHLDWSMRVDLVTRWLEQEGYGSLALAPLGIGDTCVGSLVLVRPPGARRWSASELAAVAGIGRDLGRIVANTRALERERRVAEELRRLDAHKSELIATITHELKNPLTALRGYAELLADEVPPQAPLGRSLAGVDRAARRLGRAVEDLLLLARLSDPDRTPLQRRADLASIVRAAPELVAPAADQADVTIDVTIADSVTAPLVAPAATPATTPAATSTDPTIGTTAVLASGDADELERLVEELVLACVRSAPAGTRVRAVLEARDDELLLTLTDDGDGMSEAEREQLQSGLFRGAGAAPSGHGLGLAIAGRILQRHDGRLHLTAPPDGPHRLRLRLPRASDLVD